MCPKTIKLKALIDGWILKKYSLAEFKQTAMILAHEGADLTVGDSLTGATLAHHLAVTNKNGVNDGELNQLLKLCPALANTADKEKATPLQSLLDQWYQTISADYPPQNALSIDELKKTAMLLARKGANLLVTNRQRVFSLFHLLIFNNKNAVHQSELEELLELKPELINFESPLARLLLNCPTNSDLETFKKNALFLARNGADLTVHDVVSGKTLLNYLITTNTNGINDKEINELLAINPKLITQKDNWQRDPLQVLMEHRLQNKLPVIQLQQNALLLAAHGADLTVTDRFFSWQHTILHHLVLNGQEGLACLQKLPVNSEIINAKNGKGYTPLHYLLSKEPNATIEQVEILVHLGSQLTCSSKNNHTLLSSLSRQGNLAVAQYLVTNKGLQITEQTPDGKSLLHHATGHHNEPYWEWLLTNGCAIDTQDHQGATALHDAITRENKVMVQWLIQKGARLDIFNEKDQTPLALIRQNKHLQSISLPGDLTKTYQRIDLLNAINKMKCYGQKLKDQGDSKGDAIINLAEQLRNQARLFLNQPNPEANFAVFHKQFNQLLENKSKALQHYRFAWETIVKNIAIALTGIGMIAILGNLAHSKVTQGKALFFFQKRKTNSEQLLDVVVSSFSALA